METALRSGEYRKVGSVLIARHGRLAYELYLEGSADSLRNTRSATKTVAGILVGIAVDKGLLGGVDDLVMPYLADRLPVENPDPRKDLMTLEDLLTMSSALECDDFNDLAGGNEERMYLAQDWVKFALDLPVKERSPCLPQQREFSYCTAGAGLLAAVLTTVAGCGVEKFAREVLFAPLGVDGEKWFVNPCGVAFTGGGLELRSRDLLKLGQLYLDGGRWHGVPVVSRQWVEASVRPQVEVDEHTKYGYLWWLRRFRDGDAARPAYLMSGNGGNKVCVFDDLHLVVVITTTNYSSPGMHEQTDRLLTDHVLPSVIS
jgi:CubicO group peptidase (beta-lactamase class C family)